MVNRESNRRSRRVPLTSEEVANIVAYRKRKEYVTLQKLKKTPLYKILNVFNVVCMFIYLELIFCFYGPCNYIQYTAANMAAHYSTAGILSERLVVSDLDVYDVQGSMYRFVINDNIEVPKTSVKFAIGHDFLLRKKLKGVLETSDEAYRLFSASPILLLCGLGAFISFFAFIMNLNENPYTLSGLTVLNALALLAIIMI